MVEAVANRFISSINQAYRRCIGFEVYGDTTEFYDESGCVVMTATQNGRDKVQIKFAEDEDVFNFEEKDKRRA